MKRVKVYAPASAGFVNSGIKSMGFAVAGLGVANKEVEQGKRHSQLEVDDNCQNYQQILQSAAKMVLDSGGDDLLIRNLANLAELRSGERDKLSPEDLAGLKSAGEAALWSGAKARLICPHSPAVIAICKDHCHAEYIAKIMKWALNRKGFAGELFLAEIGIPGAEEQQ